ncbi:MAG TPA: LXG domain-containing protein, partial [Bacillaceae bacterium]
MKILDAHGLHAGVEQVLQKLEELHGQTQELQKAVGGIIALEDSLKGQGGSAIRSFYQEFHQTFLVYFQTFSAEYATILAEIHQALRAFEKADYGFIHQGFLENNVEQGLRKAELMTKSLTNDANLIIQQVADIVSLPRLHDDEAIHHLKKAQQKNTSTLQGLYNFDQRAAGSLDSVEHDLVRMQNFVEQMQGMFKSGEITVSTYKPGQLMESGEYRKIVGSLAQKAGMEPLETIEREANGNYKSIRYHVYPNGLIVMEYQYIGSDDQIHHEIVREVPDELVDGVKFSVFDRSVGGIVKGSEKAVGEIIEGFIAFGNFMDRNFNPKSDQPMDIKIFAKKLADDPKSTLAGIGRKAIDMPKYMWEGITNAWKRDVLKGDATSRAEFFTYAFVTVGLGGVADKGASKVGTLAKTGGQASKAKSVKTGVAPSMNLMPEPVLVPAVAAPR